MKCILIDTDVILDFFFDRKPHADRAAQILSLCESREIVGYITPVILSNLYYLLRQTANHDKVIEKLSMLVSFIEILEMNRDSILKALGSNFKDFEDALQNYAAENSEEIELIVTRNIKDFKNSHLAVMTPDDFMHSLEVS